MVKALQVYQCSECKTIYAESREADACCEHQLLTLKNVILSGIVIDDHLKVAVNIVFIFESFGRDFSGTIDFDEEWEYPYEVYHGMENWLYDQGEPADKLEDQMLAILDKEHKKRGDYIQTMIDRGLVKYEV